MLKSYLSAVPYTKCIIIQDALVHRDPEVFEYLVKQHLDTNRHKVQYFVFEGIFKRIQKKYQNYSKIVLHDFVSDFQNWVDEGEDNDSFESRVLKMGENDIVIVNSLSNVILLYGLSHAYRICNSLKNNKAIQQIIMVLHTDLIGEDNCSKVCNYFNNVSTLSLHIKNPFMTDKRRIEYEYIKRGGKIISQIEEYRFEGESLITNKIEKPDARKFLEKTLSKEINPEQLSTFRIGLTDEEKLSKDKVVLPYLPKTNEEKPQEEGNIFYQLDDLDDWDEEDPDDDLDI